VGGNADDGEQHHPPLRRAVPEVFVAGLTAATTIVVWIIVAMNLIRGIPVLVDGRTYLVERYYTKEMRSEG